MEAHEAPAPLEGVVPADAEPRDRRDDPASDDDSATGTGGYDLEIEVEPPFDCTPDLYDEGTGNNDFDNATDLALGNILGSNIANITLVLGVAALAIGWTARSAELVLSGDFFVWSLAGNFVQPIFQGGRLRANVDLNKANVDEATALYVQDVLLAFGEVESILASGEILTREEVALVTASEQSSAAQRLADGCPPSSRNLIAPSSS